MCQLCAAKNKTMTTRSFHQLKARWALSVSCMNSHHLHLKVDSPTPYSRCYKYECTNPQEALLARHAIPRDIPVRRRRSSSRSPVGTSYLTSVCHRGTCSRFCPLPIAWAASPGGPFPTPYQPIQRHPPHAERPLTHMVAQPEERYRLHAA